MTDAALRHYDRDLNNAMEDRQVCAHDDIELRCPMCTHIVDEDHRFCGTCLENVDPVRVCLYCEEELGTLGDYEQEVRLLQQLTDSLAAVKPRCPECGDYGAVITHAGDTFTPPETADCPMGCP